MKYALLGWLFPLGLAAAVLGCSSSAPTTVGGAPAATTPGRPTYEDVAEASGVTFRHFDPASPKHLMSETVGSGLAWIDYDNDGLLDLFCVQDSPTPTALAPPAVVPGPDGRTHKLYRNLGGGKFEDVTEKVGLNVAGYGQGVTVGDVDNDGFDDIIVSYLWQGVSYFHNEPAPGGGRRFVDRSAKSGLVNTHWGTSCALADIDNDGFLDLYLCNYVEMDIKNPQVCTQSSTGITFGCSPTVYPHTAHKLFRNNRDDTFTDVSEAWGLTKAAPAPGLAVLVHDLDGDGKPDIYVANDMQPAYLLHNKGDHFEDVALPSGCALGVGGVRMAGMGVDIADLDSGGDKPSIFVTNFHNSPNVLFRNRGAMRFLDESTQSGIGPATLARLAFGVVCFDADLDGVPDVAYANGHIHRVAKEAFGVPYQQEMQLFLGGKGGRFQDASATCGASFLKPRVARGLVRGDYDNDGVPDLAASGVGEPIALFRGTLQTENAWVSLELVGDGKTVNRNAIGASALVEWGGRKQAWYVPGGGTYLSANDRRLLVGLGPNAARADKVTVTWPNGTKQVFADLAARKHWRLTQHGTATEAPAPR